MLTPIRQYWHVSSGKRNRTFISWRASAIAAVAGIGRTYAREIMSKSHLNKSAFDYQHSTKQSAFIILLFLFYLSIIYTHLQSKQVQVKVEINNRIAFLQKKTIEIWKSPRNYWQIMVYDHKNCIYILHFIISLDFGIVMNNSLLLPILTDRIGAGIGTSLLTLCLILSFPV